MHTRLLFREDAYLQQCPARVIARTEDGAIVLDQTVFYATGGGQPGDTGHLSLPNGATLPIKTAIWANAEKTRVAHVCEDLNVNLSVGDEVVAHLDWLPRFQRMRMHTALHLLSVVLPFPVTGGAISDVEGRLDFDIPDASHDREALTLEINRLVATNAAVSSRWISDEELDASPHLVKTMAVKPPRGSGHVRLVEIAGLDLQPCGGTHVRATGEVGAVVITQIEKKGKLNRRVRVRFDAPRN
jgi:misacylated tRNA(Ala) deacylase